MQQATTNGTGASTGIETSSTCTGKCSGTSRVFAGSLGGMLLRVRAMTGRAQRRGEDNFVRAARPWLRKLLASPFLPRLLAEHRGEHLEADELMAAALVGLGDAMNDWDPEKCPSFAYFGRWRVYSAIAEASRRSLVVPGVRPSRLDEFGSVELGADGNPETAAIEAEDEEETSRREAAVREALAALSETERTALYGRSSPAKTRAVAMLKRGLLRHGLDTWI